MKQTLALFAILTLAACGADGEPTAPNYISANENHQPSVLKPGLHISGSARVGVKKTF